MTDVAHEYGLPIQVASPVSKGRSILRPTPARNLVSPQALSTTTAISERCRLIFARCVQLFAIWIDRRNRATYKPSSISGGRRLESHAQSIDTLWQSTDELGSLNEHVQRRQRRRARSAISAASGDIITFAANITLGSNPPTVTNNVTFNGGASFCRAIASIAAVQQSGTIAVNDLIITNAKAHGGTGGSGDGGGSGGGCAGLGGALFIGAGTNVTVSNVSLQNNSARGGDGGSSPINYHSNTSGGGGGYWPTGANGGNADFFVSGGGGTGGGGDGFENSNGGNGGFGGGGGGATT